MKFLLFHRMFDYDIIINICWATLSNLIDKVYGRYSLKNQRADVMLARN